MILPAASVCTGVLILLARSILWLASAILLHDGIRREQYRRLAAQLSDELTDVPDRRRNAIRIALQERLTPVGRQFSRWLRPHPHRTGGRPNQTNARVDHIARLCILLGLPALVYAANAGTRALVNGVWNVAIAEILVGTAAILTGLLLAAKAESRGFVPTVLTAALGAIIGGLAAGYLLCSLPISRAAEAQVNIHLNV